MTEERALARTLASIIGNDHVSEQPELSIDGLNPGLVARPASAEEVLACMRVCSESDAAVVPAGQMTWLECGNPLRRIDVVLSLDRMERIIEYSPPDLTATVEAGVTLSAFNSLAVLQRQWLPLDPPGFGRASLGAVAACNSSGAFRLGFGAPRDYIIGLRLVHADGTESKSGGKVVKNVAGYDMNKLYAGSYGTLAIITELTFKLRPLPDHSSTILITSQNREALFDLAKRVLVSELQPASVVLTRRLSDSPESSWPDDGLLIRVTDSEASVEHQVNWVLQSLDENYKGIVLREEQADDAWRHIAHFDSQAIRVRLSVPLSAVQSEFEKAFRAHPDCAATVDIGTGIIRISFDAEGGSAVDQIKRIRASAAGATGTLTIEKAPVEVRRSADAWGTVGSTVEIMRAIKTRFDRQSLLNPGKFGWD